MYKPMSSFDKYIARCQKRLKEWNAPLSGWGCISCIDVLDHEDSDSVAFFKCELCGCEQVRYIHLMHHKEYFEDISVGCVCAGIMEVNLMAAKERDRKMKNRAKRKSNFIKHEWHRDWRHSWSRVYRYQELRIFDGRNGFYSVTCSNQSTSIYNGKPIKNYLSALYAAFDLADPIEDCYHA